MKLKKEKWIILTDESGAPRLTLNSDAFLRAALFQTTGFNPLHFCHRPLIHTDPHTLLGDAIAQLRVHPQNLEDDVIDQDIMLYWSDDQKRIITGADVLGRLLRGIAQQDGTLYIKSTINTPPPN